MRILLLPNSYPPRLGGLETVSHTLAQQLIGGGHQVQVITQRHPRTLPAQETIDGIPVQRWLLLEPDVADLQRGRPDLFFASLLLRPLARWRMARQFRILPPEVVNVHFPDHQTPLVLWLRKRHPFRLVVSLHGHEVLRWFHKDDPSTSSGQRRRGTNNQRELGQLRGILQEADAVTACSGWLLNKAIELEPSVAAKGHIIHNGVDLERFQEHTPYRHPRPYILAYGRFTHKKGFDLLLDAFARVSQAMSKVDLLLAGDGEERKALEQQAEFLGIGDRVHFFGRATPQEIVYLLNGCGLAVIPSKEEPFGIVALEALAAGKPVLATQVGGLPEVLGNGDGVVLVEPTVEGLAAGLRGWLIRLDERQQWGEQNRDRAAHFTWDRMTDAYLRVYRGEA